MSIVTSEIVEDRAQIDGRRSITERHTDHTGKIFNIGYLAEQNLDVTSVMNARVAQLEEDQKRLEVSNNVETAINDEDYSNITHIYSTFGEFVTRLRQVYSNLKRLEVGAASKYFATLSNAQLQQIFSVDAVDVVTLRTRLEQRRDRYNAIIAEAGE